jgi:signal transduction histidine kinase
MSGSHGVRAFARSRIGRSFAAFAVFCATLSAAIGYRVYHLRLDAYVTDKRAEKTTALGLVDAFVAEYAEIRQKFSGDAPVPATYRAHAIGRFNNLRKDDTPLRLVWVGRPDRFIATPPGDAVMAAVVENFAHEANPAPRSGLVETPEGTVFRTVYPSLASDTACVNCHNRLQPDKEPWHLNDVMGAFSIEVPAGGFLRASLWESAGFGVALFAVLLAVGLALVVPGYRRLREREANYAVLRQAKEEAEAASHTKSQILANMSHELRTPLNAIIGFSDVISQGLMGPVDERYREYAGDILRAGSHLLKLITDVLDLSKIESGHLRLHEARVDLVGVIDACHRLVVDRARDAFIRIERVNPPDVPLILGDELRLKQIVLNLLSNAVKFTALGGDAGGTVRIEVKLTDAGVTISIADTGIGMKPEDIPVALAPFRQLDDAFTRRYEGTGLGLPLAKMLTELHGGVLEITSAPGLGTTVNVRLPRNRILSDHMVDDKVRQSA